MAEPVAVRIAPRGAAIGPTACVVALPLLVMWGSPILALVAGAAFGLSLDRAPVEQAGKLGKLALQSSIVLMAFRMDLGQVATTSARYVVWIAVFVPAVLALGVVASQRLRVARPVGRLLSAGTAICGATAIATLAPTIKARSEQLAVCLAIVFVLNAVAVITFPLIGDVLGMTQEAFGVWAALAIHDTASVVAAAAQYGDQSLQVATTLKILRMLCLIPVVCLFAYWERTESKASIPRFVLLFIAAALASSMFELPAGMIDLAGTTSYALIIVALFFVGSELRRATLMRMRGGELLFACTLWLTVVAVTLAAVLLLV